MSLSRLLKYINIAMAVLLVAGLAWCYWYAWHPLPRTSGVITGPVSEPVSVVRDEIGLPHITAASVADAIFAQGFVTAQDRMFQMDLGRRRASGELAAVLGEAALESDQRARYLRLDRLAEAYRLALTPETRAAFTAYARGVNYYLETHADNLPVEFTLSGFEPRPWSVKDSILIALEMYRTLTDSWRDDVLRQQMIAQGNAEKVRELFPSRVGTESVAGSNAWVISGDRTSSGRPILANDPHLQFSVPSIWYLAHLRGGDELDVIGGTIPGLPGVVVGHNQRIAWGSTNLGFDVQDLYAERLDPATGIYAYGGQLLQAGREQDWIAVKGQENQAVAYWVTLHGPVVVGNGNTQLALHWTAYDANSFDYPYLAIDQAGDWDEFLAALQRFSGPTQNFVFADADGNIGYQAAGKLPLRGGGAGTVPLDGTTPESNWTGYIPFEELPSAFNPDSGILVTSNQNPFPAEYPYRVNGQFAPPYRSQRIRQLLEQRDDWSPEDMFAVQTDIRDSFLKFLAGQAVAAYDARPAGTDALDTAADQLREWDGEMDADAAAPLVATLLYQHIRKAVADRASPGAGLNYADGMAPAVVERLLRERQPDWFDDYDQIILRSFVDAVDEGRRMQGADVAEWEYGRARVLRLAQPVVSRLPVIGSYFRFPDIPLGGSAQTVRQTTPVLGPSLRMSVEPGEWDDAWINIMPGQSGNALGSHRRDQWDAYWEGTGKPLEYQPDSNKNGLTIQPER